MTPLNIRSATEADRAIAYDSWWKQMVDLRPPQTPMGLWRRGCQERVERILKLSNVMVATSKEDTDDVLGLVCFVHLPAMIHFVYVKFHVRGWGIAGRLIKTALAGAKEPRFTTYPRRRFMGLVAPHWSFDPFAGTGLHLGTGPFLETRP